MTIRFTLFGRASANGAIMLATIAAACLGGYATPTIAQSIIQGDAQHSDSSFQSFSTDQPTKVAMLENDAPSAVVAGAFDVSKKMTIDLPAPAAPAKKVSDPSYRIPFSFPTANDANEAVAVEHQGMPRIGPALETRDYFIIGSQDINDLAFAFVSPLESDHDIDFLHFNNN